MIEISVINGGFYIWNAKGESRLIRLHLPDFVILLCNYNTDVEIVYFFFFNDILLYVCNNTNWNTFGHKWLRKIIRFSNLMVSIIINVFN